MLILLMAIKLGGSIYSLKEPKRHNPICLSAPFKDILVERFCKFFRVAVDTAMYVYLYAWHLVPGHDSEYRDKRNNLTKEIKMQH